MFNHYIIITIYGSKDNVSFLRLVLALQLQFALFFFLSALFHREVHGRLLLVNTERAVAQLCTLSEPPSSLRQKDEAERL